MAENKKNIFSRLFGNSKKEGCCGVRIEEVSEAEEATAKASLKKAENCDSCSGKSQTP
jgi:hypothetical protein